MNSLQFLRVSRQKKRRFFPCGAFLSRAVVECLSKCPNSEKTPLPEKIPGYVPAGSYSVSEQTNYYKNPITHLLKGV